MANAQHIPAPRARHPFLWRAIPCCCCLCLSPADARRLRRVMRIVRAARKAGHLYRPAFI